MNVDSSDILGVIAERPPMRLAPGRCIRLRGGASCDSCRDACPGGLPFSVDGEILAAGIADECTSCGVCAAACPTGAIELPEAVLTGWLRRIDLGVGELREGQQFTIACGPSRCSADLVVPCVLAVDASLLLRALATGTPGVLLVPGDCGSCVHGREAAQEAIVDLADRVTALGVTLGLSPVSVSPAGRDADLEDAASSIGRREFLSSLRDEGRSLFGALLKEVFRPDETLPEGEAEAGEPAPRRRIAVAAVGSVARRAGLDADSGLELPPEAAGSISHILPEVDTFACRACGDCAVYCPTGAIRATLAEGRWLLSLSARRCVGCGACERLCRDSAISFKDHGLAGMLRPGRVVLHSAPTSTCVRCSAVFAATDEAGAVASGPVLLCPTCRHAEGRFADCY